MDWHNFIGHEKQRDCFQHAIAGERLGGSFLFVGPAGVGKRTFALLIAKTLLCENRDASKMEPCNRCDACIQVDASTHPDLLVVRKPEDRASIPLELLIGSREARMQEGLCRDIRLRPFRGRRRIAILQDADYLSEEAGNCLLKTLEEPPPQAILILIGTNQQRQLPTIRSRCQTVRFFAPRGQDAVRLLQMHGVTVDDADQADRAIEMGGGDVRYATHLFVPEFGEFRETFTRLLCKPVPDAVGLAKSIGSYVDTAGKEAPKRRQRIREIFGIAVQVYRQLARTQMQQGNGTEETLYRLDRALDALNQVDRNANQAILIECWAADIQRGSPAETESAL